MTDWPEGYGRRVLAEVDSTNAEAARIASGLRGPEWILALRQTAGRGRRGRAWVNPEGNFAATLVLPLSEPPDRAALRSFVAALALYDAVAAVSGTAAGLALKWPNDVLLNGGKLAGILLESTGGPQGWLAIGVGVNLLEAPSAAQVEAGAVPPVSLLAETGVRVTPETFLTALARSFARHERTLTTLGFDPLRRLWLSRAARLGETVSARTPRDSVTGIFETVDASGQLVLKTPKGRVSIAAADIFFE